MRMPLNKYLKLEWPTNNEDMFVKFHLKKG
jgi:hypothetical protein